MQIERDARGDFILKPEELADRFGMTSKVFRRNMQLGFVKSMVETGEGEHAGTSRLTLRCGNRIWRAVVRASGEVMNEQITFAPGRAGHCRS